MLFKMFDMLERRIDELDRTYVLTAYLKNSVTRAVDPLSVMACRVACLVAIVE